MSYLCWSMYSCTISQQILSKQLPLGFIFEASRRARHTCMPVADSLRCMHSEERRTLMTANLHRPRLPATILTGARRGQSDQGEH